MARDADILFKAELDASGAVVNLRAFKGEMGEASQSGASSFGFLQQNWQSLVAGFASYVTITAAFGQIKDSIEKAMEKQDAVVRLDAALRATAYSAGLTGDQIRLFAGEMQNLVGRSHETVEAAAAILTAFSRVRGEAFEQTLKTAGDLAALFGGDLSGKAEALGRAMQMPENATRALRAAGIILTATQREQITAFTSVGDVASADAAILADVRAKVEGVDAAMASTTAGALRRYITSFGEVKEHFGTTLMLAVDLKGVFEFWNGVMQDAAAGNDKFKDSLTKMNLAALGQELEDYQAQLTAVKAAMAATPLAERVPLGDYEKRYRERKGLSAATDYDAEKQALMALQEAIRLVTAEIKAKTEAQAGAAAAAAEDKSTEDQKQQLLALADALKATEAAFTLSSSAGKRWSTELSAGGLDLGKSADTIGNLSLIIDKFKAESAEQVRLTAASAGAKAAQTLQTEAEIKLAAMTEELAAVTSGYGVKVKQAADQVLGFNDVVFKSPEGLREAADALDKETAALEASGYATKENVDWRNKQAAAAREAARTLEIARQQTEANNAADRDFALILNAPGTGIVASLDAETKALLDQVAALDARTKQINDAYNALANAPREVFSTAIGDSIIAAISGEDFAKSWQDAWKKLSANAGKALSTIFDELGKGKSLTYALQSAGLVDQAGKFNWKGAIGMAGGMIEQYGAAQNNQGLAAIGGAISGGVAGGMAAGAMIGSMGGWNWVGAIIGALVGGALAYFSSSGAKSYDYNISGGLQGGSLNFGYGGPDVSTMANMNRQVNDVLMTNTLGFRDLLKQMKVDWATLPQSIHFAITGSTQDAGKVISDLLNNILPKVVFDAYRPRVEEGLASLGVSTERVTQLMAAFTTGTFAAGITALQDFVTTLLGLRDASVLLGQSGDELRAKAGRTLYEVFNSGFDDVMKRAGELSVDTDKMFSSEQIANAKQLITLGTQQYNVTLGYIATLMGYSKGITTQVAGAQFGFAESRASQAGGGALAAFYESEITKTGAKITGAKSGEQVSEYMNEMVKLSTALWNLSDVVLVDVQAMRDLKGSLDKSYTDTLAGWAEQTAKEQGVPALQAYYEQQLASLKTQLYSATTSTQVSDIMALVNKYSQSLWGMNTGSTSSTTGGHWEQGAWGVWNLIGATTTTTGGSRQTAQDILAAMEKEAQGKIDAFIRAGEIANDAANKKLDDRRKEIELELDAWETIAQGDLTKWEDEAAARNLVLKGLLDDQEAALEAGTTVLDQLATAGGGAVPPINDLGDAADGAAGAINAMTDAIGGFIQSLSGGSAAPASAPARSS